jgi:hypothetical protein
MESSILHYALKNLKSIQTTEKFYATNDGSIIIEFSDGRCLKISEDEIIYQATEYLKNELNYILNYKH